MVKKIVLFLFLFFSLDLFSQNVDIRLLRFINSSETLPSDRFFQFVSNSGVYVVLGVPAAMSIAGLIEDDRELLRNAAVSLATAAINTGITLALKYSINRERPFITYPDIRKKSAAGSPSFPSGHTSDAFALATSLSLSYPEWYIIVPSYLWAGTVGFSRMDLGVHYPSDVLAGAVVGAGSAYLTYKINKLLINKKRVKPCDCPK